MAVDDLELTVESGTFFGFLGPNGAGKSTTIKMLTGLLGADAGHGSDPRVTMSSAEPVEAKKRMGVVPEELGPLRPADRAGVPALRRPDVRHGTRGDRDTGPKSSWR